MILIRRLAQLVLLSTFLVATVGLFPAAALAHEGGPQLLLDAGQHAPGESIEVRGANLGTDLVVRVELVADGKVIPLGNALCDGHDDFTQRFTLPEDLPSGTHTLQAVEPSVSTAKVVLASTQVSVRASWSRVLGTNGVIVVGLVALVVVVLGGAWFLRRRQQSTDRALKQPNVHLR